MTTDKMRILHALIVSAQMELMNKKATAAAEQLLWDALALIDEEGDVAENTGISMVVLRGTQK